jgi:hypothetical protein
MNPLLRFDGFYADSAFASNATYPGGAVGYPVFLYSNGSAFCGKGVFDLNEMSSKPFIDKMLGGWGNYLIGHDTITIEKFEPIQNEYKRVIIKGIISKDQITWFSRKERRYAEQPLTYSVHFHESSVKPDSTKNFTRIWPKYNK